MGFNSFTFAREVVDNLLGNLGVISTSAMSLQLWTNSTAAINTAYTMGDQDSDIAKQIRALQAPDATNKQIEDFIKKYITNSHGSGVQPYAYLFSQNDISALLEALSEHPADDPQTTSTQMAAIQSFGQTVSANMGIETATGDTSAKAEGSFAQQSMSAQQSISDMGTSVAGILGAAASMLMQSFL